MSGPEYSDILELARRLQKDLADAQAKLTTITMWLAAQPDSERTYDHACSHCGFAFSTERRLATHLANVHDGPPVPLTEVETNA